MIFLRDLFLSMVESLHVVFCEGSKILVKIFLHSWVVYQYSSTTRNCSYSSATVVVDSYVVLAS